MNKYTLGKTIESQRNQFEVILVGETGYGDFVVTREFYLEEEFNKLIADELIKLLTTVGIYGDLREFTSPFLYLPLDQDRKAYVLDEVTIMYYNEEGIAQTVHLNLPNKTEINCPRCGDVDCTLDCDREDDEHEWRKLIL